MYSRKLDTIVTRLAGVATVISTAGFFWGLNTAGVYINTLSKHPIVSQGRIYRFNQHGFVVYLTASEKFRMDLMFTVSISAGAVLFVCLLYLQNARAEASAAKSR